MNRAEFLNNIRNLEKVYIIQSGHTRCPFIECDKQSFDDKVFMFTDEKDAKNKLDELNDLKNNVFINELKQEVLPSAIASLVLYGINAIEFKTDEDTYLYQIDEIVRIPAREDKENQLFENPNLAITMAYFMQEIRKNDENADKEKLSELENEMLVNVMRAKYLLPVSKVEERSENNSPSLLIMKTPDDKSMLPIFTDHMEFGRFRVEAEIDLKVLDFQQMVNLAIPDNAIGYVINPSGIAVVITKTWLERIKQSMVAVPPSEDVYVKKDNEK